MSHVIWNLLLFHASRLFISFYYMQERPNISNPGEKVMILISNALQFTLFTSFMINTNQKINKLLKIKKYHSINFSK